MGMSTRIVARSAMRIIIWLSQVTKAMHHHHDHQCPTHHNHHQTQSLFRRCQMRSLPFTGWHAKLCFLHHFGSFFTKDLYTQPKATEAKHWTRGCEPIGHMFKANQKFAKCFHIAEQFVLIGMFRTLCGQSMIVLGLLRCSKCNVCICLEEDVGSLQHRGDEH